MDNQLGGVGEHLPLIYFFFRRRADFQTTEEDGCDGSSGRNFHNLTSPRRIVCGRLLLQ